MKFNLLELIRRRLAPDHSEPTAIEDYSDQQLLDAILELSGRECCPNVLVGEEWEEYQRLKAELDARHQYR